jgi:hypothetical protein
MLEKIKDFSERKNKILETIKFQIRRKLHHRVKLRICKSSVLVNTVFGIELISLGCNFFRN